MSDDLNKEDSQLLKNQEKLILGLIDELRQLYSTHSESVRKQGKKMSLKHAVEKVVNAI